MSFFTVIPSSGSYGTTLHPYKLLFQMKMKVQVSDSSAIPRFNLSLSNIGEVCAHSSEYDYLVGEYEAPTRLSEGVSPHRTRVRHVFEVSNEKN
ncbi:replication factor A protein [Trifolium medium]|uniref:Replication factor A protein n=1 Tax=Trifolium medium TaxID=97028 RepID=A0A392PBR4_9FABA|nr:replication factor A protein [Trifolium medium]